MELTLGKFQDTYGYPILNKGNYTGIYLSGDGTNCKLSYIHGSSNFGNYKEEEKKELLNFALNHSKGCVILNTISKTIFNRIVETYPVYYAHNVPIGYNSGFQYHVCFKNTLKINLNCREPQKKENLDKPVIKKKLEDILKQKRRKTDYVDEFIASI